MTVYHISTLTSPEDFLEARFGHMENLVAKIKEALNRPDIEVYLDADDGQMLEEANTEGPDQKIDDNLINVHIRYAGMSFDESTEKGVWDILMGVPHVDNDMGDWTNSYTLFILDEDMDALEEVAIENGNPHMFETIVDRINFWLPKL